MICNAE